MDWAVPKEVFKPSTETASEGVKDEEVKDEEVKEEIKEEEDEDDERVAEWGKEEEDGDDSDEEAEEDDDAEEDDEEEEEDKDIQKPEKKPHNLKVGHDVNEGKTVFIRNLSYDSEESDLKALMEELFGRVAFAKMVMDKAMGHPRGTAFVKFLRKEDALKAIHEASPEGERGIFLDSRRLGVLMAQGREEVQQKMKVGEGRGYGRKNNRPSAELQDLDGPSFFLSLH